MNATHSPPLPPPTKPAAPIGRSTHTAALCRISVRCLQTLPPPLSLRMDPPDWDPCRDAGREGNANRLFCVDSHFLPPPPPIRATYEWTCFISENEVIPLMLDMKHTKQRLVPNLRNVLGNTSQSPVPNCGSRKGVGICEPVPKKRRDLTHVKHRSVTARYPGAKVPSRFSGSSSCI